MDRKSLIVLFVILLIILIILIIFENIISKNSKLNQIIEENRQEEEYVNSRQYKEETIIKDYSKQVTDMLVNEDYDSLYSIYNPYYLDYKYNNDKTKFIEDIKQYCGGRKYFLFQEYVNKFKNTIISVVMYDGGIARSVNIMVDYKEDAFNSIIIGDILSINKLDISYKEPLGNVIVKVNYIIARNESFTYSISFENVSENDVTLVFEDVILKCTNKDRYLDDSSDNKVINIKAGATVTKDYNFIGDSIYKSTKSSVDFIIDSETQDKWSLEL